MKKILQSVLPIFLLALIVLSLLFNGIWFGAQMGKDPPPPDVWSDKPEVELYLDNGERFLSAGFDNFGDLFVVSRPWEQGDLAGEYHVMRYNAKGDRTQTFRIYESPP